MERTRNRGKFGRPGALFPNKIDQGRQNALYRFSDFIRREELHLLFTLKSKNVEKVDSVMSRRHRQKITVFIPGFLFLPCAFVE